MQIGRLLDLVWAIVSLRFVQICSSIWLRLFLFLVGSLFLSGTLAALLFLNGSSVFARRLLHIRCPREILLNPWIPVDLIGFSGHLVDAILILHALIQSDGSGIKLNVWTVDCVNLSLWGVLALAESSVKLNCSREDAILPKLCDAVLDVRLWPVHFFPLSPNVRFKIWNDFRRNVVELNRRRFHASDPFLFLLLELFCCFRLSGLLELLDRGLDLFLRGNGGLCSLRR